MKQIIAASILWAMTVFSVAAQFDGDYLSGLTKEIGRDRMIPAYCIEVTFDKTVHIIFPSTIRYVDLGSSNLIAGKAGDAENVIRVKSAVRGFEQETNFSVICDDGSFYSFNVLYADEPKKLNMEMKDFIHDGNTVNRPNNAMEVFLKELGQESPLLVKLVMQSVHRENRRYIRHIGSKKFGIQYLLKGVFTCNNILYFHTQAMNYSNVPFDVDFVRFKIVDKKQVRRTAIQETVIYPVRAYNYAVSIGGRKSERTVFAFDKFTIPDDKIFVMEMIEKNGGRHQTVIVENTDLIRAKTVDALKIK